MNAVKIPKANVWTVCHNPEQDLWQAVAIINGIIEARGELVEGQDNSYTSLSEQLTEILNKYQ